MNIDEFYEKIGNAGGISRIWKKMLDMLKNVQPGISDAALALFCIYFSLLDDGNTCIPLDPEKLSRLWEKKWKGICTSNASGADSDEPEAAFEKEIAEFNDSIAAGIREITAGHVPNLIGGKNPLFTIEDNCLFAQKYFKAKRTIENRIGRIFGAGQAESSGCVRDEQKNKEIAGYFLRCAGNTIKLEAEQCDAIVRGQSENLIITGGPGTGKTTVVCFLLWELFRADPDLLNYTLYLAAPSGKAADRLKESISSSLELLCAAERIQHKAIFEKLNAAQTYTIHRLLSYNPGENRFSYNADNPFPDRSIFVIDEASMIDISLFAALLEAIPDRKTGEKGPKVFILGDKDQLPSVQAGAVLGELLSKRRQNLAELKKTRRFDDNSEVGRLKNAMLNDAVPLRATFAKYDALPAGKLKPFNEYFTAWKKSENGKSQFCVPKEDADGHKPYPVTIFDLDSVQLSRKEKRTQIEEIVTEWSNTFYDKLAVPSASDADGVRLAAEKLDLSEPEAALTKKLDVLWDAAVQARILCAEREGDRGVQNINATIRSHILKRLGAAGMTDDFFAGELLLLTKNQGMFNLYNGDSGIVVTFAQDTLKYLMVKKEVKESDAAAPAQVRQEAGGIIRKGNYMFYPLYLLPGDAVEAAYAITIHKSQGSGYNAILIFLPERIGHPLLNRQIVYTAITRTSGSTYIVSSEAALDAARKNSIVRITGINL